MKSILLLRHAKSSWDSPTVADFERPLAKRGLRTAPKMGQLIQSLPNAPQLILCSTALRARQTAELVIKQLSTSPRLQVTDSLYGAEPEEILTTIKQADNSYDSVLVIAHNPGLEELASRLDADFSDVMPTAALVVIDCDTDHWENISTGQIQNVFHPRQLFPEL